MEKSNGKLIFYGDEVPITFPPLYNNFVVLLREILGLEENFLSNIRLSYRDKDDDKIEIKTEQDYNIFFDDIRKGKPMTITIEVKEESNLDIKSCSSSILNYVEKKSGNINNVSEEIKKNSIELNEENNNKEQKLDLNENSNINNDNNNINKNLEENSNQLIMNNNINNINNNINNINNNEIDLKEENNKNIPPKQNNINNNINNINNNINNNNQIPFQKNQNEFNNNNNINNINNINVVPQNQNIPQMSQNQNMSQMNQMSQNPQMNQMNQMNVSKLTNKYLYMIQFPFACSLCRLGPIYRVMYYCKDCNLIICPKCESREGERHYHPLYKVQNGSQFQYLNINGVSTMDKIMDKMEGAYNSVLGFFGANGNNNNGNNNNSRVQRQPQVPQLVSVVQLARNIYDLRNVTDQQIEEALIKCKGNIDEAVFSLVPK